MSGEITWDSMDSYGKRYSLAGNDFEDFAYIIRSMNNAYLDTKKK